MGSCRHLVLSKWDTGNTHWEKKWSQNGATLEGGAVFSLNNHVPGVELSYVPWNGSRGGAILDPLFFSVHIFVQIFFRRTSGLFWWDGNPEGDSKLSFATQQLKISFQLSTIKVLSLATCNNYANLIATCNNYKPSFFQLATISSRKTCKSGPRPQIFSTIEKNYRNNYHSG